MNSSVVIHAVQDYSASTSVQHCRYLFGDFANLSPRRFEFQSLILATLAHVQDVVLGWHGERLGALSRAF